MRRRNVFEVTAQLETLVKQAIKDVERGKEKQEKEVDAENNLDEVLKRLENLEEEEIKEIRQYIEEERREKSVSKLKELREDTEKARVNLKQENFEDVKKYIEKVKEISRSLDGFPDSEFVRDFFESLSKAVFYLDQVIEREKGKVDIGEEVEKLLKNIEEVDEEEIERIQAELDDEELEKECRELWEKAEEAREYLKNYQYGELKRYLKSIKEVLQSVETGIETYRLDEKYDIREELSEGAEASVFLVKDYDDRVLRILKDDKSLKDLQKRAAFQDQLPEDVNAALTVEVGEFQGDTAEVIRRAPGKETHIATRGGVKQGDISKEEKYRDWSSHNEAFAEAPQEHFDKLVEDTRTLVNHSIQLDAQGCNLFYHQEKGFTWIDLGTYRLSHKKGISKSGGDIYPNLLSLVACPRMIRSLSDHVDEKDRRNVLKIYAKLDEAGFLTGPTEEQKEVVQEIREGGGNSSIASN